MSQQVLLMKYHPAEKEVSFTRINSGKETPIKGNSGSVLSKYINAKGHFVLQDHGKQLFDNILEAFDGEEKVTLQVVTTKKDYEDFVQMVDFYNEESEIQISAELMAELPDMDATYEIVKNHGLDSIDILKRNRDAFYDVPSDNENVKTCIDNFAKEINDATKNITSKIDSLEQNTVNICFSGPYSSGKSLLIDSLIGYAILPTDIRPETAAMFTISSPKSGETVRINFHIEDSEASYSEIAWNEAEKAFNFVAGPSESKTRKAIQEVINECQDKRQYEQMHDILDALNANENIERVIRVFFPIAIDNEKVQFTIFDTPGTDSGVVAHREILKDALSEQTHSILVFVTYPNGLSGGGNKALLEYLSEIDKKEDRSTIDLGRSLFVINYADSLTEDEQFEAIRTGKISNKKDMEDSGGKSARENGDKVITIKLSDKKVFFTTAKYAYPAAAYKHGVATRGDERLLKSGSAKDILDEEFGRYYRQDRCAMSEFATKLLHEKCLRELEIAEKEDDLAGQLWVASGLYALQMEIVDYGEKYASAVKAFSIIDGVDKALARLNRNAKSIERQNSDDIHAVEEEISKIKGTITKGISEAKKGKEIGKNESIPSNVVEKLHLDAESISRFVQDPADAKVDEILLGFWQKIGKGIAEVFDKEFNPKETKWEGNKENEIENVVQDILNDYTDHFKDTRRKLLEKLRDEFIADVKRTIQESGEISEDAKNYILDIETPEIDEFTESYEFGELYKKRKKTKKVLWMEKEYLDREMFIKDMNKKLRSVANDLAGNYIENYKNSLNALLKKVESEFIQNMDKYSVSLRAKLEDKEAMEDLRKRILQAVDELHGCQEKLNAVIWEVK